MVWLICKKTDLNKDTALKGIQTALGNNDAVKIEIEGVRKMSDTHSEICLFVKELKPDGTTKRIFSSLLSQGLNDQVLTDLTQIVDYNFV